MVKVTIVGIGPAFALAEEFGFASRSAVPTGPRPKARSSALMATLKRSLSHHRQPPSSRLDWR